MNDILNAYGGIVDKAVNAVWNAAKTTGEYVGKAVDAGKTFFGLGKKETQLPAQKKKDPLSALGLGGLKDRRQAEIDQILKDIP